MKSTHIGIHAAMAAMLAVALPHPVQAANSPDTLPAAAVPDSIPDSIIVYFASGSTAIRPEDDSQLDHAARLFRAAKPIIMQVSGTADSVGSPEANLRLSQARADAVLQGLIARGIPASRFQVLAKGVTDPPVPTAEGVPEEKNRRVQITWR